MTAGNGRRILAVDDELQILRALKATLRAQGYEVITAASMEEGLDAAALGNLEGAIVDLLLPDGDGIELCRRLREWTTMPIIVLARARGVVGYLRGDHGWNKFERSVRATA